MNNKELKALIKEKISNIEIKDVRESILEKTYDLVPNEVATYNKSKKYLRPVFAAFSLVVIACGALAAVNFIKLPSKNYIEEVSKAKELLSYEVSALGNIMASESVSSIKRSKVNDYNVMEANNYADEIHSYLVTGEMLFNKDNFSAVHEVNDNLFYSFEHKLVVTYSETGGFSSNYTMYYDETRKIASDKPLDEVSTFLEGIMIIDDEEYIVKGEKDISGQNYDTTLMIYTDEDSYIEISQETSKDENQYKYEFVDDGEIIRQISLDLDNTLLYKKMEIVISEDYQEKHYSFDYKSDSIYCEYEDIVNSVDFDLNIDIYDGFYLYNFSEYIKIIKEK